MSSMRVLADESRVAELLDVLATVIRDDIDADGGRPWCLVGIRSRGDVLARRLGQRLGVAEANGEGRRGGGFRGVGSLDITLYRDDLSEISARPVVRATEVAFDIDGLNLVLVDDVLMTGRSVRAALGSLMDLGRPRRVWLAVLVDRGGRELPIQPDHVGLDLTHDGELDTKDRVQVRVAPTDPCDAVVVRPHP